MKGALPMELKQLTGTLMWVTHVPTRKITQFTSNVAKALNSQAEDVLEGDFSFTGHVVGHTWYSETGEEAIVVNETVIKTGTTDSRNLWTKGPSGEIKKFIITRSKMDAEHTLAVTHDITHSDTRLQWLQRVNFKKRTLTLPNENILTFKHLEVLGMYVRGYSHAATSNLLKISVDATKARIKTCRELLQQNSLESMRIELAASGLLTFLLLPVEAPFSQDLQLEDVLKLID